ncbi:hypothetical protein [Arthrobacter sp. SX1312]|uniref:hypothetical protein n=1 Tax=Arthrobacter sp. SX1312 TaxID=2058896 RepID=UPI000CE57B61|nr:hypothetical protein [Arthrobacter sp. SX1312]
MLEPVAPASDLSKSQIDWSRINERDFNHLVEVLLIKKHAKAPGRVDVIRGAGGDTGIDVVVWRGDKAAIIYQLKYFPEGFTGGFRENRRPQVKKSFDTAWKNHSPEEWILVMPPNPHINESNYVDQLAKDKAVRVEIMGQAKLTAALTDYPEVERAFTRDELVDLLERTHQEKAGLVGGTDLSARIQDLVSLANTRSQYWDVEVSTINGEVFEEYVAKHPDAMVEEPIITKLTFQFGEEHQDEVTRFQDSLNYGMVEDLDLPGETATFSRSGPSWVKPMPATALSRVRMSPVALASGLDGKTITFDFRDEAGFTQGRFEGVVTRHVTGEIGSSLRAQFANILTLTMQIPFDPDGGIPKLKMVFNAAELPVRDVQVAIDMLRSFQPDRNLDVYVGDLNGSMKLSNLVEPLEGDDWTEMLVEDLSVIEKSQRGVSFVVPESIEPYDRVNIRVARLLLDGYQTVMAPRQSMSVTLKGDLNDGLGLLLRDGGALLVTQPAMAFDIQGSKLNLGPGIIHHPHVRARDGEEALAAIEAGTAAGRVVHLEPVDETPFRVWLQPRADTTANGEPEYRAWGIPTFDDPVLPTTIDSAPDAGSTED